MTTLQRVVSVGPTVLWLFALGLALGALIALS
jgi:hypothetical protein